MKLPIIIDFDQVLADTQQQAIDYVNKRYRINTTKSDYGNGLSFEEVVSNKLKIDISFAEFYLDFTSNFTTSHYLHETVQLLPGVVDVIPLLAKEYALFISTAKNSLGLDVIIYILARNMIAQYFTGVHFVYSYNEKREFIKSPKVDFIKSFNTGVAYFIDDSVHEIEKSKVVAPSILLEATGTKCVEGAWTLKSWYDIADLVL